MTRVEVYLRSLSVELRRRFITDTQIIDEVGGHLADAVDAARQQGADDDDAQRRAIAHFGAPEVIGAAFAADRTWARWSRTRVALAAPISMTLRIPGARDDQRRRCAGAGGRGERGGR
jgi:hypothetical protein